MQLESFDKNINLNHFTIDVIHTNRIYFGLDNKIS